MRHLTYTCHPLSRFKLLIADDIHYYPFSTLNMFSTFTDYSTHASHRNLVGYIIKFHTTFLIFLMGGSSNLTLLKMLYSSSWFFLHLQKHTTFIYYTYKPCTPFYVCCFFMCNHIFLLPIFITHHFHNIPYRKCGGRWASSSVAITYICSYCIHQNLKEKP